VDTEIIQRELCQPPGAFILDKMGLITVLPGPRTGPPIVVQGKITNRYRLKLWRKAGEDELAHRLQRDALPELATYDS